MMGDLRRRLLYRLILQVVLCAALLAVFARALDAVVVSAGILISIPVALAQLRKFRISIVGRSYLEAPRDWKRDLSHMAIALFSFSLVMLVQRSPYAVSWRVLVPLIFPLPITACVCLSWLLAYESRHGAVIVESKAD